MEVQDADLGARLAQIRKARGLQQKQAAKILGINYKALSHYEHGIRAVPYSLLTEMVFFYDVTFDMVMNPLYPLPGYLLRDCSKSRDSLSWRVEKLFGEYRETGRYYLLYCTDNWVYRICHKPNAPEILLVSTYHPGQLKPPETAYSVREFESIRVETVINLLNQARGWVE